jgi:hypothetical protein
VLSNASREGGGWQIHQIGSAPVQLPHPSQRAQVTPNTGAGAAQQPNTHEHEGMSMEGMRGVVPMDNGQGTFLRFSLGESHSLQCRYSNSPLSWRSPLTTPPSAAGRTCRNRHSHSAAMLRIRCTPNQGGKQIHFSPNSYNRYGGATDTHRLQIC